MNRRRSIASLLALATFADIALATPEAITAANVAAIAWLKKLDAADYAGTWEVAASAFKAAVSAPAWQQAVQPARAPLGVLRSRSQKSATFTRALPGAPDGQYVVVQYDAVYEHKAVGVETVTVALDLDGAWRVAGYFIK